MSQTSKIVVTVNASSIAVSVLPLQELTATVPVSSLKTSVVAVVPVVGKVAAGTVKVRLDSN